MAKTLEQGRAKWERKTQGAGAKWKDRTQGAAGRLRDGLTASGVPPGPEFMRSWEAGVGATSAEDFQGSISGKGDKWLQNTRAGIAR